MNGKQRLELTWLGKDNRPQLEPRILLHDPERSYHAALTTSDHDHFENCLVFGDNLLGLKALEDRFTGEIKCAYLDPPYNTGSAFDHFEDGLEHSLWLSLLRPRLEIVHSLLRQDGSVWISIDDHEYAYLRVLCDEIFGRSNFVCTIIWEEHRLQNEDRRAQSPEADPGAGTSVGSDRHKAKEQRVVWRRIQKCGS